MTSVNCQFSQKVRCDGPSLNDHHPDGPVDEPRPLRNRPGPIAETVRVPDGAPPSPLPGGGGDSGGTAAPADDPTARRLGSSLQGGPESGSAAVRREDPEPPPAEGRDEAANLPPADAPAGRCGRLPEAYRRREVLRIRFDDGPPDIPPSPRLDRSTEPADCVARRPAPPRRGVRNLIEALSGSGVRGSEPVGDPYRSDGLSAWRDGEIPAALHALKSGGSGPGGGLSAEKVKAVLDAIFGSDVRRPRPVGGRDRPDGGIPAGRDGARPRAEAGEADAGPAGGKRRG